MKTKRTRVIGLFVLTLLYPAFNPIVKNIPNPMIPGGYLALNMIFPILAGYFYGPRSGVIAGGIGTGLAALLYANMFDGLAILPHALMGYAAGFAGNYRSEFFASLTILVGHGLNILFFLRLGLFQIAINNIGITLLGFTAETMIDILTILLCICVLGRWLYAENRW